MSKRKKSMQQKTGRVGDTQEFEVVGTDRSTDPTERIEVQTTTLIGQEPDLSGLDIITKDTDTASIMRARDARKAATAAQEAVKKGGGSKMSNSTTKDTKTSSSTRSSGSSTTTSSSSGRSTTTSNGQNTRADVREPRQARLSNEERVRRLMKALTPEQQKELANAGRMANAILHGDPKLRQEEAKSLARRLVVLMHDMGHSVQDAANLVTWTGRANALEWNVEASEQKARQETYDIGSLLG